MADRRQNTKVTLITFLICWIGLTIFLFSREGYQEPLIVLFFSALIAVFIACLTSLFFLPRGRPIEHTGQLCPEVWKKAPRRLETILAKNDRDYKVSLALQRLFEGMMQWVNQPRLGLFGLEQIEMMVEDVQYHLDREMQAKITGALSGSGLGLGVFGFSGGFSGRLEGQTFPIREGGEGLFILGSSETSGNRRTRIVSPGFSAATQLINTEYEEFCRTWERMMGPLGERRKSNFLHTIGVMEKLEEKFRELLQDTSFWQGSVAGDTLFLKAREEIRQGRRVRIVAEGMGLSNGVFLGQALRIDGRVYGVYPIGIVKILEEILMKDFQLRVLWYWLNKEG